MSFLKRLFGGKREDLRFLPVHVRCARCGEVITARVDLHNDLSARYDDRGRVIGYFVRKVVIGSGQNRCFQAIEVELTFDARRNVVDRSIHGGEFVQNPNQDLT